MVQEILLSSCTSLRHPKQCTLHETIKHFGHKSPHKKLISTVQAPFPHPMLTYKAFGLLEARLCLSPCVALRSRKLFVFYSSHSAHLSPFAIVVILFCVVCNLHVCYITVTLTIQLFDNHWRWRYQATSLRRSIANAHRRSALGFDFNWNTTCNHRRSLHKTIGHRYIRIGSLIETANTAWW